MESNSPHQNESKGQNESPKERVHLNDADSSNLEGTYSPNVRSTPGAKSLVRKPSLRLYQEKTTKKIRFFRNGDKFHGGHTYVLSSERTRTFDKLLEDLTRILMDKLSLPNGVRYIFNIDGKKVTDLSELDEGCGYVCSSTDQFVRWNYSQNGKVRRNSMTAVVYSPEAFAKWDPVGIKCEPRDFVKPRLVNIIRNGRKPRKFIRFLLNKKTAHSFDQVLRDITAEVKLDSGVVRKIYTLDGMEISTLAGFFGVDDTFIAYGSEKCLHTDFDLNDEESKYLSKVTKHNSSYGKFRRSLSNMSSTPIVKSKASYARESSFCSNSSVESSPACARRLSQPLFHVPESSRKSLFETVDQVPEET